MGRFGFALAAVLIGLASAGWAQEGRGADVPRGLWETHIGPDGVVFHVRTRRCGRALCGRVERAKNRRGYDTPSNAVGDKVLWEMRPQPDGSFLGEYRGHLAEQYMNSRAQVFGREMRIDACDDKTCKNLVWKRIR